MSEGDWVAALGGAALACILAISIWRRRRMKAAVELTQTAGVEHTLVELEKRRDRRANRRSFFWACVMLALIAFAFYLFAVGQH